MDNPDHKTATANADSPQRPCSAMGVEQLIFRLATRGLLPCEHNLQIWQHADNSGWGALVSTPYKAFQAEAHGETLQAALEGLMRETNRGADISPNSGL